MKASRFRSLMLACAVIGSMTFAPAFAQDSGVVSLQEALQVGLTASPRFSSIVNNRYATDQEKRQAESLFLPRIDANADAGWEFTDNSTSDNEDLFRRTVGLTLTQLLFDGFGAKSENERQANRQESARNRVIETGEFVGLDIIESYLNVLRQRETLAIAQQNVQKHESILAQMIDGASAGRSTQADVEQAKARLNVARSTEDSVREALRISESQYILNVGNSPTTLQRPPAPAGVLAANVEEEVNRAITQSPALSARDADIRTAQAEKEAAKAPYYPRFDLQLNGQTGEDQGGINDSNTSASALVVMNWNLYRGGADQARVRELTFRQQESKEIAAQNARTVEDDVRQTWARMISAGERAKEFREQSEANQKVVDAYLDQFNLDRRTLLDVLDAQNEFFVSRSNMISTEYLELFAMYRLLAIKGQLLPTLQVANPQGSDPATKG